MNNSVSNIAGGILAAGMSTRFDGNKLLASLNGKPLICRVVEAALSSRLDKILAVLGHEADKVREALDDQLQNPRFDCIDIADFQEGQSRSVIAGLKRVQQDCLGVMYLMGDQPLINPSVIDDVIATFEKSKKDICYPSFNGKRRNPVIFGERFYHDILALTGDTGAREIIDTNPQSTVSIDYSDELLFRDVDREIDLQSLAANEKNKAK